MNVQVITMTSKGQISIPLEYRKEMALETGTKFAIFSDGKSIILNPIEIPSDDTLTLALKEARDYARKEGLTEEDMKEAIKEYRAENGLRK